MYTMYTLAFTVHSDLKASTVKVYNNDYYDDDALGS